MVVGAGLVGLATAWTLAQRDPERRLVVVDKEAEVARHQSGRNSGVLHSGVYYKPGSLKARTCRAGRAQMIDFCAREAIPCHLSGKVIVATSHAQLPALSAIHDRGRDNGVSCTRIGPERLAELEPHVSGVAALHVPEAGVVDYPAVARRLAERLVERGHRLWLRAEVRRVDERAGEVTVETTRGALSASSLVVCAGLHSDRLARACGAPTDVQIVPFRGEYQRLLPPSADLCRALIYPVPDPRFPFLGVHLTRHIDGSVTCGPNAVPALSREGYRWTDIDLRDLSASLASAGFRRLALAHARYGLGEIWRSVSRRALLRSVHELVPGVRLEDLQPAPAGVRAQALTPDGALVDDFAFARTRRTLHVINAPSPAATACLAIGAEIAKRLET